MIKEKHHQPIRNGVGDRMNFERLWSLLEAIQTQIRAFDAKAQVAIGVNGVLVGFATAEIVKAAEYGASGMLYRLLFTYIFAGASLCASLIAIGFGIFVVHPQIELKQPRSHFFYCHLVQGYGRDFDKAVQALKCLSAEDELDEVASQVAVNSVVCDVKGRRCKPALFLTGFALALYAFSVVPYSSMALVHSFASVTGPLSTSVTTHPPTVSDVPPVPTSPAPAWPYAVPVATLCGAIAALAGALITSSVTRRNAKEENALASRSKLADFREAWLNRLRDALAELGSEAQSSTHPVTPNTRRVYELAIKLRLLMNRNDTHYGALDGLLLAVTEAKAGTDVGPLIARLTEVGQDILKTEWETLKYDLEYEPPKVKKYR